MRRLAARYRPGSGRLILEERSKTTASAALTGVGVLGDGGAFRGLYEDPACTLERHLE